MLRPGGVFLFNVWDRIEENEFADTVTTALAALFPDDPPRFLARTPHGYHDRATIARDLAGGGFTAPPEIVTLAARSRAASPRDPGDRLLPGDAAAQRDRGARRFAARRGDRRRGGRDRAAVRPRRRRRQDPGARRHHRTLNPGRPGLDAGSSMVDSVSTMEETASGLNERIAERVRELRAARGLSLDALAAQERRQPLDDLAHRARREQPDRGRAGEARGRPRTCSLASLFDAPAAAAATRGPVARRDEQPEWRDPASGYVRRNVSPRRRAAADADRRGARSRRARAWRSRPARATPRMHQQVWVLEGTIDVTRGRRAPPPARRATAWRCVLDRPTMFHNPTRKPARYAVVIASEPAPRRR